MEEPVYTLDGSRFTDLSGFYDEVSRSIIPGAKWDRNLDAFNDILSGGFGMPEGGFVLRWVHSDRSRSRVGYSATVEYLEQQLVVGKPADQQRCL
jgi:RNAse (barnase) inhibitor barstar